MFCVLDVFFFPKGKGRRGVGGNRKHLGSGSHVSWNLKVCLSTPRLSFVLTGFWLSKLGCQGPSHTYIYPSKSLLFNCVLMFYFRKLLTYSIIQKGDFDTRAELKRKWGLFSDKVRVTLRAFLRTLYCDCSTFSLALFAQLPLDRVSSGPDQVLTPVF